jgi:alkylation response protein AidB-like acyl-CoA dehydrogenase
MDFKMPREQEMFKKAVRDYCERNIAPRSREIDEKEAGIPKDIIQGLADIGVFGCTIPEKYGEEMQYANIAIHEIARAELSMSLPVYTLLTIGWGGFFLNLYAREEVKQEVLPKLASGEWAWGIAVTEPGGGSDVGAIKTTAKRQGNKFVINGEKAYISLVKESQLVGGGHCSLFVTDPAKGLRGGMTLIGVKPNDTKGMSPTKIWAAWASQPADSSTRMSKCRINTSWARKERASIIAWKALTPPAPSSPPPVSVGRRSASKSLLSMPNSAGPSGRRSASSRAYPLTSLTCIPVSTF